MQKDILSPHPRLGLFFFSQRVKSLFLKSCSFNLHKKCWDFQKLLVVAKHHVNFLHDAGRSEGLRKRPIYLNCCWTSVNKDIQRKVWEFSEGWYFFASSSHSGEIRPEDFCIWINKKAFSLVFHCMSQRVDAYQLLLKLQGTSGLTSSLLSAVIFKMSKWFGAELRSLMQLMWSPCRNVLDVIDPVMQSWKEAELKWRDERREIRALREMEET